MAEGGKSKRAKKKSSGRGIWILMAILVLLIVVLGIYRFVNNNKENQENSTVEQVVNSSEYNDELQDLQKQIDSKEEKINQISEELLPLMEERTELEQQLIEMTENN